MPTLTDGQMFWLIVLAQMIVAMIVFWGIPALLRIHQHRRTER